jgi:hypothetical protein
MVSKYLRSFRGDDMNDLEYRINCWCNNHDCEPVSISVVIHGSEFLALAVMEEKGEDSYA